MKKVCLFASLLPALLLHGCCGHNHEKSGIKADSGKTASWQEEFGRTLPLLGHRNWVLVTDKAFPLQSAPGMQYIETKGNLPDVAPEVLGMIEGATHVKAIVYTDSELQYVTEELAPGIDNLKAALSGKLAKYDVRTLPHEEIFTMMDQASRLFSVVVLKTEACLPYTSLFIELDCGYWSAAKEAILRASMQQR